MSTEATTSKNSSGSSLASPATTGMSKISTSTPQKPLPDAGDVNPADALGNISGLVDNDTSNVLHDDEMMSSSLSPHHAGHHKLSKSSSATNSPVAKRHISSGSITRSRPQSSYSARVLIFDDSDQEMGGSGSNTSNLSGGSVNITNDATTKSSTALEMLASSPKNDSSISSTQSLLRNLNLTKSSSGGLSGSSVSLPARGYGALLRKISYQQHAYSMRSSSNGKCIKN